VTIALPFLLALLVSAALVPIYRAMAMRLGYVVASSGGQPMPKAKAGGGGVPIAVALFGCAIVLGSFESVPVLLLCSAALFLVGIGTDLFVLKPSARLVAIIAVASVFLVFDYRLQWTESLTIDIIVTLFWIVGVTSAFSLLDSMDGLCGGIALIAGTAFLFTVLPEQLDGERLLKAQYLAIVLGAIAGFLIYNVSPASVALGDGGSLVIGLNMAAMTLQIAPGRGSDLLSIIAIPAPLLLIPIVDAALSAMSRLGSSPSPIGDDGASHRLVAMGLSERRAVGLLWLLAAVSGAIAVIADRSESGFTGVIAAMFTIGMMLFAVHLTRVQVHESPDPNRLSGTITPLGSDEGYRRRIAEILLDLLLVSVAYYGAFRLQFDNVEWAENFNYFRQSFPIVLGTQMIGLFAAGAYRGMWRYFSLSDGVTFAKGVFVGVVTSQVAILYLYRFESYAPAIFFVYGMLLLILLTASRGSFRLISEFAQQQRQVGRRLVIYGAGDAGSIAVRYLLNDSRSAYRIVGFVDDNVSKRNMRVLGYRVIGGYDHLAGMIMAGEVDAVAVTDDGSEVQGLAGLCAQYHVTLHRLAVNWREIPVAEAMAGGVVPGPAPTEARVVPFTEARRDRTDSAPAVALREVTTTIDDSQIEALSSDASPEKGPAPIRVVHIITRLILGGAQENTLYTAIDQHRDPRFDVTLLCGVDEAGEGNMFAEANRAGVKTVVLPSLLREIRPLTDLKALFDVYRFLKRGAFSIVHTHSSKAGIIGRVAARVAGVPVTVHTLHGLVFHEFQSAWRNRVYILLKRLCAPMTDTIISVSDVVRETAISRRIGRRAQHVTIFSGIELDLFLSVRERISVEEAKRHAGIPPDAPVVGKIARLFPLKGHEQFLAVAAEIATQMPEVRFLLVGDGPLRDQLRADAERFGIGDRVVMVGRVPPETVPEYIQAMDVVVHTSLREGIARVLPQAGAVGKPVVTFDLDGAPEVIRDGVSGYLVAPVDTNRVAERTVELLRDPERRHAFGEAGRTFAAQHFSVERMVERINTLYLELLENVEGVTNAEKAARRSS
jgi:UDP-GlcNAc:undecaprenyl-phosphate GlcNAc-1-phosphate transferase